MVQIAELHFQCMAKVLPCAISQPCPIFICYRSPPGQRLPREQGDSHLDNFRRLRYTCHLTELLNIKRPVGKLRGVSIKLFWLVQFDIRACQHSWSYGGWCWCWWYWWWCLLCCHIRSMPPLDYFVYQVLCRLQRTQGHMSDLVIQVLVGKLSNI